MGYYIQAFNSHGHYPKALQNLLIRGHIDPVVMERKLDASKIEGYPELRETLETSRRDHMGGKFANGLDRPSVL